jgi:phosphoketolase
MALEPRTEHPHGLEDRDFDAMFTRDKPVIFAFHGYPKLIHSLTYRRHNHDNFHVGTTTTPLAWLCRTISIATSLHSTPLPESEAAST